MKNTHIPSKKYALSIQDLCTKIFSGNVKFAQALIQEGNSHLTYLQSVNET